MNGEMESGDFGKTAKKLNFAENWIKYGVVLLVKNSCDGGKSAQKNLLNNFRFSFAAFFSPLFCCCILIQLFLKRLEPSENYRIKVSAAVFEFPFPTFCTDNFNLNSNLILIQFEYYQFIIQAHWHLNWSSV